MWNFLLGYSVGSAIGESRLRRYLKFAFKLAAIGIVIAGLIYTYVVFKAVSERNQVRHVQPNSTY